MFITHEQYKPKNIRYGFFTKNVTIPKTPSELDLQELGKAFGSNSVAIVEQKHTNEVVIVNEYNNTCIADGQITNRPNIALGVLTADCVPILLSDEKGGIIGTVHAGWRGARANIMKNAIEQMQTLGAKNITAIIGPCIRQRSYEVDDKFYKNFTEESTGYKKFFIHGDKENHYMFDLPGYVKDKLACLNIKQILDIERNTYEEEENFFSFRRTTHNPNSSMGNIVSVIMLL